MRAFRSFSSAGAAALAFASQMIWATLALQPVQADTVYAVHQGFSVTNVPADAKQVRGWFWMPEDRPEQRVTEFRVVQAPETFRITRDPRYGRSWLYAEAAVSADKPLRIETEFKLVRRKISGMADAA